MATYHAIAGLGKTVLGLLAERCLKTEFPGAKFQLCPPAGLGRSKRSPLGISLSLYRVNAVISQRNQPNRPLPDARQQRPPLSLELHFLLTAWGKTAERQQDLLGWVMCVLDENPVLPASLLNRFAGGLGETFGQDESVQVVLENLDGEQWKWVSELVGIRHLPTVGYLARPVVIHEPGGPTT